MWDLNREELFIAVKSSTYNLVIAARAHTDTILLGRVKTLLFRIPGYAPWLGSYKCLLDPLLEWGCEGLDLPAHAVFSSRPSHPVTLGDGRAVLLFPRSSGLIPVTCLELFLHKTHVSGDTSKTLNHFAPLGSGWEMPVVEQARISCISGMCLSSIFVHLCHWKTRGNGNSFWIPGHISANCWM